MEKLSNTDAELEKNFTYKKNVYYYFCVHRSVIFIFVIFYF